MRDVTRSLAASLSVLVVGCGTTQVPQIDKTYMAREAPAVTAADKVMALRPFAPSDTGIFTRGLYPTNVDGSNNPPHEPAPPVDLTEAEARQKLDVFMKLSAAGDDELHAAAMQVFDNPVLVAKIKNHSIRAAVAALTGTIAESAIQLYLSPRIKEVKIDDTAFVIKPTDTYVAYAWVDVNGQWTYYINKKYRGENPFLLTRTLAHEPLHQDQILSQVEENIAYSLDSLVLLQLLSKHPEMVGTTELARRAIVVGLIRLNSGKGYRLGLFDSNGDRSITPGAGGAGPSSTSYWARLTDQGRAVNSRDTNNYNASPGNAILAQYLVAIGAEGLGPNPDFSMKTLQAISHAPGPLTSEQLLAAARNMKLAVPAAP
jgi:hypothetical protein